MGDVAKAVAKVAKKIDGRVCYALPYEELETKRKVKLVEVGDPELFAKRGIDPQDYPDWLALAVLDEGGFLVVNAAAPYAVGYYADYEAKLWPVWASLDEFVKSLLEKKAAKTRFAGLAKTLEKIEALIDKDQHAGALEKLAPIIDSLPHVPDGCDWEEDLASSAYNLYGLALKGERRLADARAAFDRSAKLGYSSAHLNILDMFEDARQPKELVAYALAVRESTRFAEYGRVWIVRYLVNAYLDLGDPASAERELRALLDEYGITARERIVETRTGLEKYVADGRAGASAASGFLGWFEPKQYVVTPAEAKANRAWWKTQTVKVQEAALAGIGEGFLEPAEVTDEQIARLFDIEELDVDNDDEDDSIDDVTVFLKFPRLKELGFYGTPDTIEPLRALSRLEKLTISNNIVKDFTWWSPADLALFKAAATAKKAGIEKALAAGASLAARNRDGETALNLVAGNHADKLCVWLISKGADPWAGNHGESNAFYFFSNEEKVAFEKAAAKAGIPHPELDPWRILSVKREPKAASFEHDVGFDFDAGESLAAKWPKDARFTMTKPKTDNKLYDLMSGSYRGLLVSQKLADLLQGESSFELLPVKLVDHAGKVRPEPYFVLNPLRVDCLDVDKCFPNWNLHDDTTISEVAAFVIDPARATAKVFRPAKLDAPPVVIAKALGERIAACTGVELEYPKR